jgi:hypothetical protein
MKHYVLISLVLCLLGCDGLVNPEHNAKPIIHKSADKPEQISETQTKTPSIPIEYRNALKQAASYATRMHMSKQEVHGRLVFEIALLLCLLGVITGSVIMLSLFIGLLTYYSLTYYSLVKLELKRLNDLSSLK